MKDAYTILTVNPGSTGTKLGLVRGDEILLDLNVDTPKEAFADCPNFVDQVPRREQMIWTCSGAPRWSSNPLTCVRPGRGRPLLYGRYISHQRPGL